MQSPDLGYCWYYSRYSGQENFRAIISTYYNGADAIIVTYDLTSIHSFEVELGIIRT